jgi:hypothetical protein
MFVKTETGTVINNNREDLLKQRKRKNLFQKERERLTALEKEVKVLKETLNLVLESILKDRNKPWQP